MPKTWIEISAGALISNVNTLRDLLDTHAEYCSVVKANAYGHGLEKIVSLQYKSGIKFFAVDSFDEAKRVRKVAKKSEIYLLGYLTPEEEGMALEAGFIQIAYNLETIHRLAEKAIETGKPAKINIKLETGMQRLGVTWAQLPRIVHELKRHQEVLDVVSVSSHFANAADIHHPEFTQHQKQLFEQYVQYIYDQGIEPPYIHMANSAASIYHSTTHYTIARIGIAQYGLWPSESLQRTTALGNKQVQLKPVLSWRTRIAQLKDVPVGQPIGYNMHFIADRPMRVAVLPVGYYDGYHRIIEESKGYVLIRGHKCKIIGRIGMNMMMVDVSHLPVVQTDDVVTLIGRDGMHQINTEQVAKWAHTINYEIVAQIGAHIPKIIS